MKTATKLAVSAAILLGAAGAAFAHHSTAAFDNERVIKIEGEVQQVRLINPHASLKVEGAAEFTTGEGDATDGLWTVEMTAVNVLFNQGWTRRSVQVGDHVTVYVNPLNNAVTLNDGSQGGLYVGVITADGTTLGRTDGTGAGSSD